MTENVVPLKKRRRPPITNPRGAALPRILDSWLLALRAAGRAPRTIEAYERTARDFIAWLCEHGHPCDTEGVQPDHIRGFLADRRAAGASEQSLASYHGRLSAWWAWICREGERAEPSPVRREDRPTPPRKIRRYLTADEVRALIRTCDRSFLGRRDEAIIRILYDNGVRVSGLVSMRLDGVDLKGRVIKIILKGGSEHLAPIGTKTAAAIDRYLRVRDRHPLADESPWLWLPATTSHDRLLDEGVRIMLKKRGLQAGIQHVHPHMFRGTAAHELLAAGAGEGNVRRILGWKTDQMIEHYAGDLADERARQAHARLSPGDRI